MDMAVEVYGMYSTVCNTYTCIEVYPFILSNKCVRAGKCK
jgi:hypothetical protein